MSDMDEQFVSSTITLECNIMTEIGAAVLLWILHVEYNMLLFHVVHKLSNCFGHLQATSIGALHNTILPVS